MVFSHCPTLKPITNGLSELYEGIHTAQRQKPTQIPNRFCIVYPFYRFRWSYLSVGDDNHGWYLASLLFGKNFRKIGVNTSRPESKKWWHQAYAPIRKQNLWGAFPTSWIFIKNPLVTSSIFVFISFHLDCFSQLLLIQRFAKYDHYLHWKNFTSCFNYYVTSTVDRPSPSTIGLSLGVGIGQWECSMPYD